VSDTRITYNESSIAKKAKVDDSCLNILQYNDRLDADVVIACDVH